MKKQKGDVKDRILRRKMKSGQKKKNQNPHWRAYVSFETSLQNCPLALISKEKIFSLLALSVVKQCLTYKAQFLFFSFFSEVIPEVHNRDHVFNWYNDF